MSRQNRSSLALGVILILAGLWFLVGQIFPALNLWLDGANSWPFFVIGAGVVIGVIALLTGAPGLLVPACIVGGIGGLLYWQNSTGNWASWAYTWALIPGFAGVGVLLSGLMGRHPRQSWGEGLGMIITSLALFFIFGAFLGGPNLLGDYWPVLLILLGLWTLLRPWLRGRQPQA